MEGFGLTRSMRALTILTLAPFMAACAGMSGTLAPETTDFSVEEAMLAEGPPHDSDFSDLGLVCEPALHDELWDRIRAGFAMPASDHSRVESSRAWYMRNQAFLDRVVTRARPYLHHIVEEVEARGMPMEIALLPVVESAFDPYAFSHGQASGLWQFIPGTGRRYGLRQDWWLDERRDVLESTRAALDYLEALHGMFDDWLLALAAYNTGEGNVARAIRRNEAAGRPTDFFSLQLPQETRGYAPKLLAIRDLVANPEAYGITLLAIANAPYLGVAEFEGQLDLALAADLSGMPLDDLYLLNPGLNRWATAPEGPHRLVLPLDRVDDFMARLATVPEDQRVRFARYRVQPGDALGTIARAHRTTVHELQRINGLNGTLIRAGESLFVPAAMPSTGRVVEQVDYTVRRGDSLWKIGQSHGVGVGTLASWNGMATTDVLREGQRLVIRVPDRSSSGPPGTVRELRYTVRRGDSLSRISQRFRVSVNDLRNWNDLDGQRYLQPGQRLRLWVDVTQQF